MLWLVPAVLALVAVVPILLAVQRMVAEAVELRRELSRFSELRPALLELRSDAQAVRRAAAARYQQLPTRRR